MNRLKVGVDLDGVVTDFDRDWRDCYEAEFGVRPGLNNAWDEFISLTHFKEDAHFWDWLSTTTCWASPTVIPDSVSALHLLTREHDVHVISAKPPWAVSRTAYWLSGLSIPFAALHIGSIKKSSIECDAYIDDGPHNLFDFWHNRPDAFIARMVHPWNSELDGDNRFFPVNNLFEFRDALNHHTPSILSLKEEQ
jgi:5'(3')-deoxyribonucleotidase